MRIQIDVTGAAAGIQDLQGLSSALRDAARARDQLNGGGGGGGGGSGGGGGRRGGGGSKGPSQAQQLREEASLLRAQASMLRAQNSMAGARRARDRKDPNFSSRLMDLIGTTRIGNGGVAPLVNRIGALVGGGAAGGPAGMAITAAVAAAVGALTLFARATRDTAANIAAFRSGVIQSGGTGREVAGLGSFGVRPADVAGIAAQLRERISFGSADPFALQAAQRLGVGGQLPREIGPQNEARMLYQVLDSLRKVKNAEEQLRLARILGLDSMLDELRVSDRVYEGRKRDALLRGRINTPQAQQDAADFNAQAGRLGGALEMQRDRLFAPAMRFWAQVIGEYAELLADPLRYPGNLPGRLKEKEKQKSEPSSLDANTKAVMDNTYAIGRLGEVIGGGPRGQGAIPPALKGPALSRALADKALRSGAWALN